MDKFAADLIEQFNQGQVTDINNYTEDLYWESSTPSPEALLENVFNNTITEGMKFDVDNIQQGDIFLVNSFNTQRGEVANKEHRVVLMAFTPENNAKKRTYLGYALSSQTKQASINNSKRKNIVLIKDYDTILAYGESSNATEVVINLGEPVSFKLSDLVGKYAYLGRVTPAFLNFIKDVVSKKIDGNSACWDEETIAKYTH